MNTNIEYQKPAHTTLANIARRGYLMAETDDAVNQRFWLNKLTELEYVVEDLTPGPVRASFPVAA